MSNEPISHAFVDYSNDRCNGLKAVVPITSIEKFVPKNNKDFAKNKKYKVWLKGTKNKDDLLLKAHILLLGSKYT